MKTPDILVRVVMMAIAIGLTLVVFTFWGTLSGAIGHYLSDKPAPKDTGVVSVRIIPPAPKKPPPQ